MNNRVRNILDGRQSKTLSGGIFNPRTVLLLVILSVFSFGAYFTLSGFSGDLDNGNNGGAHALSKSAIGYGGLLHLLKYDGLKVDISRALALRSDKKHMLRIVSLSSGWYVKELENMVIDSPTLIILPKWHTHAHPSHRGWVQKFNTPIPETISSTEISKILQPVLENAHIERLKSKSQKITILPSMELGTQTETYFYNFNQFQLIHGDAIKPIIATDFGTLLARMEGTDIFILSDPDFVNTFGLAQPDRMDFAVDMMNMLVAETQTNGYLFDLSLHGFVRSQNLIKLALTPPFMAATFCLLAMGLLIAWQAFSRFGDPDKPKPSVAMGKLSLINNAAKFIKLSGRDYKMAADYTELTKNIARNRLNLTAGMSEDELTKRLDVYSKHSGTPQSWSTLAAEKHSPKDATGLMELVHKLYTWRGDITHARK